MSFGFQRHRRFDRVAALELAPGQWERAWVSLRRRDVLARIAFALLTAIGLAFVIHAWDPPFNYRIGYVPPRDIMSTVTFAKPDPLATQMARHEARKVARHVYAQNPESLVQLREELRNTLASSIIKSPMLDKLDPKIWQEFQLPPSTDAIKLPPADAVKTLLSPDSKSMTAAERTKRRKEESAKQDKQYKEFYDALAQPDMLNRVNSVLDDIFAELEDRGLLVEKPGDPADKDGPGNQKEIIVYTKGAQGTGDKKSQHVVLVSRVLLSDTLTFVSDELHGHDIPPVVADRLFAWLQPRLAKMKSTLQHDKNLTEVSKKEAEASVPDLYVEYAAGQKLADANKSLDKDAIELLKLEYSKMMHERPRSKMIARTAAVIASMFVVMLLCGIYMRYRQRGPLASLTRLVAIMGMAVAVVGAARWCGLADWPTELLPVLLFGMTMAIAYKLEMGLLLTGTVTFAILMGLGYGMEEFVLLMGVTVAAVLNLGNLRNRVKLIYVGMFAGVVALVLRVCLGILYDQPLAWPLWREGIINGGCALAAAFIVLGLLPFIEQFFGVLTDLSLLELGDVAHPLLQELVRRAPSTYNHSITVGSIAEAAADSIGARGLLVRVGAYFHDIGKMLKPDYFVENQGPDDNRHEALAPAMSTLVIIAHIKDGADLARQHRLPQPIIDLIAQHHGTTRVEFFYGRATEQQLADPNAAEVDESSYRYPGPKPQTKESAVLMLADAVESASRTLVDPTPARIESLVRQLAEYRLHDGQFDESGLTLRELRTIEKSMVISLTSIYHGRIKYPEQRAG